MEPKGWIRWWRKSRYDEKVRALSHAEFRVWVMCLTLPPHNGPQAGCLVAEVGGEPLSLRDLARETGLDHASTAKRCIDHLVELGMLEQLQPSAGRRPAVLRVVNWSKYQVATVASCKHKPRKQKPTVAPTVASDEQSPQQSFGDSAVASDEHKPNERPELQLVTETPVRPLCSPVATEEVKKLRSTPTSKTRKAADADKPVGTENANREEDADQVFIRKAFERLTGLELPAGSLSTYGTVRRWVKKRGYQLGAEWVDQHDGRGKGCPAGTDPWGWFAESLTEALRKPWVWKPGWKP